MKRKTLVEYEFRPDAMSINGTMVKPKSLHTRGKTSKRYWRKSYTVSIQDRFPFADTISMKKFYLLSMSMDKNYVRNRLSFDCLDYLGLFPLWYRYTELKVNDQTEGLYLIVQRPADFALQETGSPAILRRQTTGLIAKEKYAKETLDPYKEESVDAFKAISGLCTQYTGKDLYDALDQKLDLKAYFRWLAFNYMVRNGDYADEVFYYALPTESAIRFGIIPWDFDDILAKGPHEGYSKRDQALGDQLIFSSEDKLDRTIARDPYLYERYLQEMIVVCEILTPKVILSITEEIYADLIPYIRDPAIINLSEHDLAPADDPEEIKRELKNIYGYLRSRRRMMAQLAKTHRKSG